MSKPLSHASDSSFSSPVADGGGGPPHLKNIGSEGVPPTSSSSRTRVSPSSHDPIQRWLDIFMPMTGLPRARQSDIRAELEDHLRARVDDLMITGLSEPEAVQQAVNELGETAQLAHQFRTALKPKRISPMHTALIAIAGSALTLGIFTATNQPTPLPAQHGAAISALAVSEADISENAVPTADYAFAKGGTIDLRTATLATIFEKVRANLDRPLVIHWEHLEEIGIPKNQPIGLDADPVPTEVALRLAIQRAETEDFGGIAIVDHPDAVEITTTEYLDHRTTQIRPHDIADLIAYYEVPDQRFTSPTTPAQEVRTRQTAERAGLEIFETVQTLASSDDWVDLGGDLARGRVVGGSLIIDAPARIHADVESVIAMMIEQVHRYEADARAAQSELDARAEELEAMKRREREIAIAKLTNDLAESLDRILILETRQAELEQEGRMLQIRANKFNRFEGESEEEAAERQKKGAAEQAEREPALRAELSRITFELADTHAYRDAARNQLIELRYEPFTVAQRESDLANLADRVRRTREAQSPTSGN